MRLQRQLNLNGSMLGLRGTGPLFRVFRSPLGHRWRLESQRRRIFASRSGKSKALHLVMEEALSCSGAEHFRLRRLQESDAKKPEE